MLLCKFKDYNTNKSYLSLIDKQIIKIKKENYKNKTKDMNHWVLKLKFGVLEKVIYIQKKKKNKKQQDKSR